MYNQECHISPKIVRVGPKIPDAFSGAKNSPN